MKKWKVLSSEYIYKTPFGNLRKDSCELPNGTVIDDYYVNEYSDWVNAIVITNENKVVLVEQYRHAGNDNFMEIPAGKIERNESNEEGILREVQEETGYTSFKKPILLGEFMVNPATQDNKVISYLIIDAIQTHEQQLDSNEDLAIKVVSLDDMEKMINNHQITQLFTVNAFYIAKAYLNDKLIKNM